MSQNRKLSPVRGSSKKAHKSNYSATQDSITKASVFSGSRKAIQNETAKKPINVSPLPVGVGTNLN